MIGPDKLREWRRTLEGVLRRNCIHVNEIAAVVRELERAEEDHYREEARRLDAKETP